MYIYIYMCVCVCVCVLIQMWPTINPSLFPVHPFQQAMPIQYVFLDVVTYIPPRCFPCLSLQAMPECSGRMDIYGLCTYSNSYGMYI